MNILILKDGNIPDEELESVLDDVTNIYTYNTDVRPKFFIEDADFRNLPIEDYYEGNYGIKKTTLSAKSAEVFSRWREEIDLLVFLVHEDNWNIKGIWGWNISKAFSGYEVEQVRWDKRNNANTLGTLYHEIMHSHDSFIYRYTGQDINKMLTLNWDEDVVHGRAPAYEYIRYKENQSALRYIGNLLKTSVDRRRKMFDHTVGVMRAIIQNLQKVVELQRRLLIEKRKNDLPYGTRNTICTCYRRNG